VLISQNRQEERDRVRNDAEYDTNVLAEQKITHLHVKTDSNYENMLKMFIELKATVQQTDGKCGHLLERLATLEAIIHENGGESEPVNQPPG
jgi:uncharacterized membrane protein